MSSINLADIPDIQNAPVPICFSQENFRNALANGESTISTFKDAIEAIDKSLNFRFREGENIRTLIYERAQLIDCLLHFAWHQFKWHDNINLIAVGGYGRGELHPKSDIDILLLCADNTAQNKNTIESFLTLLWDIGLNVGHSVRTHEQCIEIAREDVTVVTNLMESRHLQGQQALLQKLHTDIAPDKMWPQHEFFDAKADEQRTRHARYNDTEYNLEPNVKNAPGSLRDIQNIQWVAKRYFNVLSLSELQEKEFFTEAEYASLMKGEEFLWQVRYALHMITGREEDRLLFDHQRELAKLFGYENADTRLAVEHFMHDYYRVIISVQALNDVLLQYLDEAIINQRGTASIQPINERFQLKNKYIQVTHSNVFIEKPSALLEIFVLAANDERIAGIRASTIRLIRENRDLINDDFRKDPENCALFLQLIKSPIRLVTQLQCMKRYGILGRYLPEFNHTIGQMQHDLFHIYTVDAHTLNTIRFMRKLSLPEANNKFSLAGRIAKKLPRPELLYIAGLYHDIGKGRGGDHSVVGAEDAIAFGERHKLSKRETHMVSWLVRNHLLMSFVSQKKDISDPDVVFDFTKTVGTKTHLDYLYVLTVADMNATNPDIWNSWRASLLEELYREASRTLRRGFEHPVDKEDAIAETQEQAMALAKESKLTDSHTIDKLWQTADEDYFLREIPEDIVWHTEGILKHSSVETPLVLVRNKSIDNIEIVTQIFIRTRSEDNIFAASTSVLDQLNLTIQDARIYSTTSGYTMDTFYVLNDDDKPIQAVDEAMKNITRLLQDELAISENYSEIIKRRTPRQLKHFSAPTRTVIHNELSNPYTILEVISPDRPGLLARIARIFIEFNIELVTAKISTLGERVEDVFFITDKKGERLSDPTLCTDLQNVIRQTLDAKA